MNGFAKVYCMSAGMALAVTGAAKIVSGFGDAKLLVTSDPVLGVRFDRLMIAVGLAEVAVALVCFFGKRPTLAVLLIAWLATNFVVYRLGLWWMGWHRPCGCLGSLTDALHISAQTADNITKVVLTYLLLGSYGLLFWRWRRSKQSRLWLAAPRLRCNR